MGIGRYQAWNCSVQLAIEWHSTVRPYTTDMYTPGWSPTRPFVPVSFLIPFSSVCTYVGQKISLRDVTKWHKLIVIISLLKLSAGGHRIKDNGDKAGGQQLRLPSNHLFTMVVRRKKLWPARHVSSMWKIRNDLYQTLWIWGNWDVRWEDNIKTGVR